MFLLIIINKLDKMSRCLDENLPINRLSFIGTHDSAAYFYDPTINNNDKVVKGLNKLSKLSRTAKEVVEDWSLTQSLNAYDQLQLGIRAFDLRLAYDVNTETFYFTHTIFCEKALDVLDDIRRYLDEHPEVFILLLIKPAFRHRHTLTALKIGIFKRELIELFGVHRLVHPSEKFPTLKECLDNNQQILCMLNPQDDVFWGSSKFDHVWFQTQSSEELYQQNVDRIRSMTPSDDKMYLLSLTLSPSLKTIVKGVSNDIFCGGCFGRGGCLVCGRECPISIKELSGPIQKQFTRLKDELGEDELKKVCVWWVDFPSREIINENKKLNAHRDL